MATILRIKEIKNDCYSRLKNSLRNWLEDLGSEKKFRVASFLQQIIRHALLLQFWTKEREYNQSHWESELVNFQDQLNTYLTASLRKYLEQEFDNIYQKAIRYVRKKTNNQVNFPNTCPYSLEELLDPNWLPSYE